MSTIISKKTLSQQAKILQKKTNLTYAQSLHQVAKKLGFKNYEHFNKTKKFKIAIFSRKGGVGKTPISRNLYLDLNADFYFRTDYTMGNKNNKFAQVLPKQKTYNISLPTERLSAVYDLCRYTQFKHLQHIIEDIDLFILPTQGHEVEVFYSTFIESLDQLYKYKKPILILSYSTTTNRKKAYKKQLEALKEKLSNYNNIHYIYMNHSTIYNDEYIYNKEDRENLDYLTLPKFYFDIHAKSILQIYNESSKNRYLFKSIHQEYTQLLEVIKGIINESI